MRNPLLIPDLRELILAGEEDVIRDFLGDHHPARVAEIVEDFPVEEGDKLFGMLSSKTRAEVLSYFDSERQEKIVEAMNPSDAASLLHMMSHDERADLVKKLEEDRVDLILPHLAQAEREDIRRLASYEPGTAGAVMTTDYVTLPPNLNRHESIEHLRHAAPNSETIYYNYVVDSQRKLIGVLSLKNLILARPSARVENLMQRDLIVARVDQDQETVARQIAKYDLLAIPIVDAHDMLLGIITYDDAMDILRREQTEDILAFGGVSRDAEADEESYWQGRPIESVKRRIGWLLLLFVGGTVTQWVIVHFKFVHDKLPDVKFNAFIPLLIGTGGNAGSQTVGTIIRGLALGEIQLKDTIRVVSREGLTGLLLGGLMGTLGLFFTWTILGEGPAFGAVIGLSLLGICVWANVIGALVPLAAEKLKIDPALVSAPLISTLVDATGLCIFYLIAILLLMKFAH